MKTNFDFLERWAPEMAEHAGEAEEYFQTGRPNTSLMKTRQVAESIVMHIYSRSGMDEPEKGCTFATITKGLHKLGFLPNNIYSIISAIRLDGNDANHSFFDNPNHAKSMLWFLFNACVWFVKTVFDPEYEPEEYIQPIYHPRRAERLPKGTLGFVTSVDFPGTYRPSEKLNAYMSELALKSEQIDIEILKQRAEAAASDIPTL